MLQPIVAKAQAILRDAAPHLEGLEQEEGDEDAANERENTADADAVAMLPGFFTALERAATVAAAPAPNGLAVGNGHHGGVAAAWGSEMLTFESGAKNVEFSKYVTGKYPHAGSGERIQF